MSTSFHFLFQKFEIFFPSSSFSLPLVSFSPLFESPLDHEHTVCSIQLDLSFLSLLFVPLGQVGRRGKEGNKEAWASCHDAPHIAHSSLTFSRCKENWAEQK